MPRQPTDDNTTARAKPVSKRAKKRPDPSRNFDCVQICMPAISSGGKGWIVVNGVQLKSVKKIVVEGEGDRFTQVTITLDANVNYEPSARRKPAPIKK